MIIITGGNGFVGSVLTPLFRKKYRGEKIFILDKPRYDLVTGKNLDKIPKNPRLVIHLAAATDTAKPDHRANDLGTINLFQYLKIGPGTHFIFTSSLAVYSGRTGCDKAIGPKTSPAVNNRYGATKLKAEKILVNAAKEKGFKLTILRLPTVWGNNPRKNSFLNFLKSLVKNNSIFARLNWPGKTALINVNDIAKHISEISKKSPKNTQIVPLAVENMTLAAIFKTLYLQAEKDYGEIKVPEFVWSFAKFLRPSLGYFEPILPSSFYNYFWRASIVVDSPLWCKVNLKGRKFAKNSPEHVLIV